MNTPWKHWFVTALAASVFLSSVVAALGGEGDKDALALAPQEEPRLKVGSTLVIAVESAKLVVGNDVVATVPKGQRIVVIEVRDSWVGTRVSVSGRETGGWILIADFVPDSNLAKSEAQIYTASETIASESAPNVTRTQIRRARSDSGDDYFRDYYTGYYTRHETDPNVHVWEPWNR